MKYLYEFLWLSYLYIRTIPVGVVYMAQVWVFSICVKAPNISLNFYEPIIKSLAAYRELWLAQKQQRHNKSDFQLVNKCTAHALTNEEQEDGRRRDGDPKKDANSY